MKEVMIFEYFYRGDSQDEERHELEELLKEGWFIVSTAPTENRIVYVLERRIV